MVNSQTNSSVSQEGSDKSRERFEKCREQVIFNTLLLDLLIYTFF